MFCNQCGTKLPDDALFCPECGAKQEVADMMPDTVLTQNVQPLPEKKKWKPYKIFIPIGVVLTAAILIFVLILVKNRKPGPFTEISKDMVFYMDGSFFNLSGEKFDMEGDLLGIWYSGDGTVSVYMDENNSLFYINDKLEPVLVSEDVVNLKMAVTGEYFVYVVREERYYEGILYLYDVKKEKSVKMSEDVFTLSHLCISPDGKTVAYMKDYEGFDDNTLYLCTLGKDEIKVDKDGCYPIAISEGGKYFYYVNTNDKLYRFDKKGTEKIATDISGDFWFSSSVSEMLFTKNGKTYYYDPKMGEPVRVCGSVISSVVLPGQQEVVSSMMFERCCSDAAVIVGKDSLKNSVLVSNSDLYWLNGDGSDTVKIASYIYDYQLSADGKSLIYLEDGELYRIKKLDENMETKVLYDKEFLDGFVASLDLSKIYIVTDEAELFYLKGKNKTEKISTDFEMNWYRITYNDACNRVFYIEDYNLYSAGTNEKSKEEVEKDVYEVVRLFDGVMYDIWEEDEEIYYYMEKEPVKLMSKDY